MKCARCGKENGMPVCDSCFRHEKDGVTDHDVDRLVKRAKAAGISIAVTRDDYRLRLEGKLSTLILHSFDEASAAIYGYNLINID